MIILAAFFGFFALMSLVALVKFQGNPVFLFTLLLSGATLIWLVRLDLEDRSSPRRAVRKPRRARR